MSIWSTGCKTKNKQITNSDYNDLTYFKSQKSIHPSMVLCAKIFLSSRPVKVSQFKLFHLGCTCSGVGLHRHLKPIAYSVFAKKTVCFLNVTFHIALEQFGLLIHRPTFLVAHFIFYRSTGRKLRDKNVLPDRQGLYKKSYWTLDNLIYFCLISSVRTYKMTVNLIDIIMFF